MRLEQATRAAQAGGVRALVGVRGGSLLRRCPRWQGGRGAQVLPNCVMRARQGMRDAGCQGRTPKHPRHGPQGPGARTTQAQHPRSIGQPKAVGAMSRPHEVTRGTRGVKKNRPHKADLWGRFVGPICGPICARRAMPGCQPPGPTLARPQRIYSTSGMTLMTTSITTSVCKATETECSPVVLSGPWGSRTCCLLTS